jgi:hypothetical protein
VNSRILYYRSGDRQFLEVGNEVDPHVFGTFLEQFSDPLYSEFSSQTIDSVLKDGQLAVCVRFSNERNSIGNYEHRLLTNLTDVKLPIVFFASEDRPVFDDLVNPGEGDDTAVAIVRLAGDRLQRWIVSDLSTAFEFAERVRSGSVPEYRRSETAPMDNSGSVVRVVGSMFDKLVLGSQVPFVLLVYRTDNYAFQAQLEQLSAAAGEFGERARFGFLNVELNEVEVACPDEVPAVGVFCEGRFSWYGKAVKVALADWIRSVIRSDL